MILNTTQRGHEPTFVIDRIRSRSHCSAGLSITLVHESGHHLAARALGIKVEEFSIGFGRKLLGWTAFGNEFSLRALPLGGYVLFPEHYVKTKAQLAEPAKMLHDADNERLFQRDHNDTLRVGWDQDVLRKRSRSVCKSYSRPVRCGRI